VAGEIIEAQVYHVIKFCPKNPGFFFFFFEKIMVYTLPSCIEIKSLSGVQNTEQCGKRCPFTLIFFKHRILKLSLLAQVFFFFFHYNLISKMKNFTFKHQATSLFN
jgi:hypothetical protein